MKKGFTLIEMPAVRKRGFTLIEMLVAVFVFMILFLIAASFVNLATGSTKSNRTKMLTGEIRNAMDTINLKLSGGNSVAKPPPIFGFNVINNILAIATADNKCMFYGFRNDGSNGYLAMVEVDCGDVTGNPWVQSSKLTQRVTSTNINVKTASSTITCPDCLASETQNKVPVVYITIDAEDADAKYKDTNQIKLKTSYTMDYETLIRVKSQP